MNLLDFVFYFVYNACNLLHRKEALKLGIKEIFGIILVIVSFGYLILNPSQSMMDGLQKKRKQQYEQMQAEKAAKEAAAKAAEADAEVTDTPEDSTRI